MNVVLVNKRCSTIHILYNLTENILIYSLFLYMRVCDTGIISIIFSCILFIIIIGGILLLFIYITRLASNEIFHHQIKY